MIEDVCSTQELKQEHAAKRAHVVSFLEEQKLDAVLISRHENIAWLTAGLSDTRVGVLRETGAASLLVTRDNRTYLLTTNNEVPRFTEEDFAALDVELVVQPWFANDIHASIRKVAGEGIVATDNALGSLPVISLQPLRFELTQGEVKRYRWLGGAVANTCTVLLRELRPGITEREIQAKMAERFLAQGILPSVYLGAVDDRVRRYKHPVPRRGVLEKLGMIGFCARRWGLTACMTRFVHFGQVPNELAEGFAAVAQVNARLQAATRTGMHAAKLYEVAREAYASAGHAGAETMHHQGGATGYLEREWIARPGGVEAVAATQAYAWNPSLNGAKAEDTVLLQNGSLEVLTATPELPLLEMEISGVTYRSADILSV